MIWMKDIGQFGLIGLDAIVTERIQGIDYVVQREKSLSKPVHRRDLELIHFWMLALKPKIRDMLSLMKNLVHPKVIVRLYSSLFSKTNSKKFWKQIFNNAKNYRSNSVVLFDCRSYSYIFLRKYRPKSRAFYVRLNIYNISKLSKAVPR